METIDVLINSCSRPDILDVSFRTFKRHVRTDCNLRYVILEDKTKSKKRRELGRKWIEEHAGELDEIVYAKKFMGPGNFFGPIVNLCRSKYFFHLEDDNRFIVDFDIDHIIQFMKNHEDVVEVMLSRGKSRNLGKKLKLDGVKLTEFNLFSVATGLFNTTQVRRLITKVGRTDRLHEFKVLTPAAFELGLKCYVLGHNKKHYEHIEKYRKGGWKKI